MSYEESEHGQLTNAMNKAGIVVYIVIAILMLILVDAVLFAIFMLKAIFGL